MSKIKKIKLNGVIYDLEASAAETDPVFSASPSATIKSQDITNWNNKSDFSGNYNDLTNKPDLSNFITKTVNDLTNYYLKSDTYTKNEVNSLIGAIQQFHYEIVQTLPASGEINVLYLVPKSTTETQNYYNEYVYANNTWEKIGDTQIDLTGYATEEWVNAQFANYTTTTNLTTLLNAKQNTINSSNKLSSDLVDDTNNINKFVTTAEKTEWSGKQAALVSGTNIKTVNNQSLLGEGNIEIQGGVGNIKTINNESLEGTGNIDLQIPLVSGSNIKTINNNSVLGNGNIEITSGEVLPVGSEIDYDGQEVPEGWQQIENPGGSDVYSETETEIGTWINGETLYRKVYHKGSISASSSGVDISINIPNIDTIIRVDIALKYSQPSGDTWFTNWQITEKCYDKYNKTARFVFSASATFADSYVILEYTKTN